MNGIFGLPLWAALAVIAVLGAVLVVAALRGNVIGFLALTMRIAVFALVVWAVWLWADRSAEREQAEARRALEARALELASRAVMPGSALACLDATAGEAVEVACEKALFANAESVAAATAYVSARLTLLSDALNHSVRTGSSAESIWPGLRRALELDRFGFVAKVLATRDGCSPDACRALDLFRDPSRVRANLKDKVFDGHVARHAAAWSNHEPTPGAPTAAIAPPPPAIVPPATTAVTSNDGPSLVPPGFSVPSAASIPPVSIMTPEPPAAAQPDGAAADAAPAGPAAPLRRAVTPRPAQPRPVQQTAPPASPPRPAQQTAPPASPPRPAQQAAPPPPVQITPPGATAGTPPRAQ